MLKLWSKIWAVIAFGRRRAERNSGSKSRGAGHRVVVDGRRGEATREHVMDDASTASGNIRRMG